MRIIISFLALCLAYINFAHAAPPPEAFGELPGVYDAAISPDATQIGLFVNIEGTYGIRILSINKKDTKPRAILLGEGVKPKWIKWVNNDRVLVALWQSGKLRGIPFTSSFIYTLDVKKMKGKFLIKPPELFRQFNDVVVDFLEDDPDHILMSFSDDNTNAPDIQKVDVVSGRYSRQKRGSENIQYWHTDLRGEPRIGQGRSDNSSTEKWTLRIRDAEQDRWRDYDNYPGLEPDVDIFGFTGNPNELIIGDYAGKETQGLYIYDLEAKKQTRKLFHHDTYDVRNVILSSDGSEVMGASFVADERETELFGDYDTVLERMRQRFANGTVDYIDQSQNGKIVLFGVSNSYDPGSLLMVNSETDKVTFISSYRKNLPAKDMGEAISVKYTARDGFKIPAYVTLPPSVTDTSQIKNLPFIILPHGGPYARTSKHFDYFAQFFATRGFGVLQMNFRGSAGYGKAFKNAGRENWVLMKEDVEDGTRWLIEKGYADPSRICIAGWSYGGYAALMGAIKNPELYACSISMAGVTDLQDMINDIKKYRFGRVSAQNFVLRGFEDRDAIKENSPVKRADEYSVPLFLAHGKDDQRVHFDQYTRMKRALRKSPAKTTFMEFDDEDHFLSNQKNRQKFFVGLDKFLRETVGESEFKQ